MHYILDALKVNIKLVSPSNHGSLKTERYIQTINNLITRQLTGKGREWPLYVMSTCYAMNTFVSTSTDCYIDLLGGTGRVFSTALKMD